MFEGLKRWGEGGALTHSRSLSVARYEYVIYITTLSIKMRNIFTLILI